MYPLAHVSPCAMRSDDQGLAARGVGRKVRALVETAVSADRTQGKRKRLIGSGRVAGVVASPGKIAGKITERSPINFSVRSSSSDIPRDCRKIVGLAHVGVVVAQGDSRSDHVALDRGGGLIFRFLPSLKMVAERRKKESFPSTGFISGIQSRSPPGPLRPLRCSHRGG